MVRSLAENARRSFWHEWRQVACPTLVVLARTSFLPAQEADEMLRQRPATMAMSIPGTGHDLHLEQPGILHTVLTEFLEGLA
jgi:pimeloyl-ACP methyl ester carboxylesterase